MTKQTEAIDERYAKSEKLKIHSSLAMQEGDTTKAEELGAEAE